MSVSPDRIACPRCGSNNFATQAACWKCGSSLVARGAPTAAAPPVHTPPPTATRPAAGTASQAAPASPAPTAAAAMPMAPARGATVDPAIASGAAIALAIFFPWVAVPAGLIFLMLDDRRKVDLGKITLVWGIAFSILHMLITAWLFAAAWGQVRAILPPQLGGTPMAAPNLNQDVGDPFQNLR